MKLRHQFDQHVLVHCQGSSASLATAWRLMVGQPFKAGILVPRVETLGYPQPSLRDYASFLA